LLLDARDHEHCVVGGQAEGDAEQEHQARDLHRFGAFVAQRGRQPALLEREHDHPERRAECEVFMRSNLVLKPAVAEVPGDEDRLLRAWGFLSNAAKTAGNVSSNAGTVEVVRKSLQSRTQLS